jgi:hypothetical protein
MMINSKMLFSLTTALPHVEGGLANDNYDAEIHWIVGELKLRGLSVPR